jgi:hypothetical protein
VFNGGILEGMASGLGHSRLEKMPLNALKDVIAQKQTFAAFVHLKFDFWYQETLKRDFLELSPN